MTAILDFVGENRLLSGWNRRLDRCPRQQNRFGEADAELMPLSGNGGLLATTIDTIAEEIALGIYVHPETIGWMAAVSSLSDLAAVGAEPVGVVVSVSLPGSGDPTVQQGIADGLAAACRAAGTFVLGGDTNRAEHLSITSCAVGTVHRERALRRVGCMPGDVVYATGRLGAGAAVAAAALLGLPASVYEEKQFRPRPRLAEAQCAAPFASAAMDTSDGLVATLDQLARLNGVGFEIDAIGATLLEPGAERVCEALHVPPLAMLAAHHGEFELVLSVPEEACAHFEAVAFAAGHAPLRIGRTTADPILRFGDTVLDGARIRNLANEAAHDVQRYFDTLLAIVA